MNEEDQETTDADKKDVNEEEQKTSDEDAKNVNVVIEVSKDEVEVYLTLIPLTESPEFSTDEIRKALSDKEIKIGIKEEVLVLLDKEIKYNERLLIASGMRPKEGKDGTIKYFFESNQTVKIKKGEKIAEIIPPEEGAEGTTVFGEQIPFQEPIKARIPRLINVEFSTENEDFLVANIDGYLFIDQSNIQVTPFFKLEKLVDEYEAYVKVTKLLNKGDFNGEDLKRFLSDCEIVYGILEEEIENIFKQEKFEQPVLAAQGKRVVHGAGNEIKYCFDTEVKPQMDESGTIDYKELNLIQNVKKGDKLAEIIPPQKGLEGCTIFGKKIQPEEGALPFLPMGQNTQPDPNDPNILLAEIDGSVKLKGTDIEVEPVFIVKENVDFSTGNIDFNGSVIVNGDVKSGFRVKAEEDVQIEGVVEDAVIEAGGNVLLKTGFIGRGEGQIIAQGEVAAKFCENENIISEGDIYIDEYVMHSKIQTKGHLFVKEKMGIIVGGEIYALKGIEAKVIGNRNYCTTKLFVGFDIKTNAEIRVKKTHVAELEEYIKKIEMTLQKISPGTLIKRVLPEDKQIQIDRLNQLKNEKEEDKKIFTAEIEDLESRLAEFKNAVVKVIDVVYPGTTITIYNRHITVEETLKHVYYKHTEIELVAADLG